MANLSHPLSSFRKVGTQNLDTPDVSVIMPCSPRWIASACHALTDVCGQTFSHDSMEVIIGLDGHPSSSELANWEEMAININGISDVPITIFHTEEARRTGDMQRDLAARTAKGRYFVYADDDDQMLPWCIDEMVRLLEDGVAKVGTVIMRRGGQAFTGRPWVRGNVGGSQVIVAADVARACVWNTRPEHRDPRPGDEAYATDWMFLEQCRKLAGPVAFSDRLCINVGAYKSYRDRPDSYERTIIEWKDRLRNRR